MVASSHASSRLPVSEVSLARALADVLDLEANGLAVTPLGASSRETPWRVDLAGSVEPRIVLVRFGDSCSANEVTALQAMERHPLPTPQVLHWDAEGAALGTPFFVSTFIEGDPLLDAMKANEPWADALYIETACAVQSVTRGDLPPGVAAQLDGSDSALTVLEEAYAGFAKPNPLAEAAYRCLKETQPEFPPDHFSNGDLWPENLLVLGDRLAGIIDWQHAGFGDPIYEFMLPFFLVP